MKLRAFIVVVLLLLAALTIKDARASRSEWTFKTQKEKVSYALGINLANQLRTQALDIDPEVLSRGLRDALLTRKALLTDEEARSIVAGLQKELKARQALKQRHAVELRQERSPNAEEPARLGLLFKVDPRITSGVYGAKDRWVSPPIYSRLGDGRTCAVEVRAVVPPSISASPAWTSLDPQMVTITPNEGGEVRILVQHAGDTRVRVTAGAAARELRVHAANTNGVLQIDIAQN